MDIQFRSQRFAGTTSCVQLRHTISRFPNGELLYSLSNVDDFVSNDETKISWSEGLKKALQRGLMAQFCSTNIRVANYRPFVRSSLYFYPILTERRYQLPGFFPVPEVESENRMVCLTGRGSEKPFMTIVTNCLTDYHFVGPGCSTQCFPFYTYDEDGSHRRENITDWAARAVFLAIGTAVEKWQIFHYVYGLLHSQEYREDYQANLKRELPRVPLPQKH